MAISHTIPERLDAILDAADQLSVDINRLMNDAAGIDSVEALEHLADLPGDLSKAYDLMESVYARLEVAKTDAIKGGLY